MGGEQFYSFLFKINARPQRGGCGKKDERSFAKAWSRSDESPGTAQNTFIGACERYLSEVGCWPEPAHHVFVCGGFDRNFHSLDCLHQLHELVNSKSYKT